MKIEFNTPEEYELFRRVMEAVKNQPQTPAQAFPGMGGAPFSMGQEHELLHLPEIGATRFRDSIPILDAKNSVAGYPYGSTRYLWGIDITAPDTVYVGAGWVLWDTSLIGGISGWSISGKSVTVTANTQYIKWSYTSTRTDFGIMDNPQTSPFFQQWPKSGQAAQGPLYVIYSRLVDGVRTIYNVKPYHFGPVRLPTMPSGFNEGDVLTWDASNNKWRVEAPYWDPTPD